MTQPTSAELDKILKTAVQACDIGQKILQDYFGRISDINEKELAGLVSEADIESEKAITQYLRREYPDFDILGEESAFKDPSQQERLVRPGRWCIDPLDGTTNYIHQMPIYCVSIGFEWEGETIAGAIHVPNLNKVYYGRQGGGAFVGTREDVAASFGLGGTASASESKSVGGSKPMTATDIKSANNGKSSIKKMKISQRPTVEKSLLATGFSSYDKALLEKQIRIFAALVARSRGVRRAGSAAYDLCLVAEGVFDGYWESRLQPWDTSAGILLVREAGGVVTDYSGGHYRSEMSSLIAGNRAVHAEIMKTIAEA